MPAGRRHVAGAGEQTFEGSLPLLTYPLSVSRNAAAHVFVRSAASAVPRSSQKSLPQRVRINVINVPRRWRRRRERWQVGQLYHNAAGIASMPKWLPAPLLHRCACWWPQCDAWPRNQAPRSLVLRLPRPRTRPKTRIERELISDCGSGPRSRTRGRL